MRRSLASLAVMLVFASLLLATSKARDPNERNVAPAAPSAPPPAPLAIEEEGDAAGFAAPPPPRPKQIDQ